MELLESIMVLIDNQKGTIKKENKLRFIDLLSVVAKDHLDKEGRKVIVYCTTVQRVEQILPKVNDYLYKQSPNNQNNNHTHQLTGQENKKGKKLHYQSVL